VQLLHLLVLGVRGAFAATRQHPPVETDPDAEEDEREEEEDGEDADQRDLQRVEVRPVGHEFPVLVFLVVLLPLIGMLGDIVVLSPPGENDSIHHKEEKDGGGGGGE